MTATPIFDQLVVEQSPERAMLARLLHEQHVKTFDGAVPARLLTGDVRDCDLCWELAQSMRRSQLFDTFIAAAVERVR